MSILAHSSTFVVPELDLWQAAKGTVANRDMLVELFERIESFFERIKIYTEVPPPPAVDGRTRKDYGRSFVNPCYCDKGDEGGKDKWVYLLR